MNTRVAVSKVTSTLVLALTLAVSASGCAGMRAAAAKRQYIDDQTKGFVYEKPRKEVWAAVRELVFEKGFELKNKGDEEGTFMGETEWKHDKTGATRYLIQLNQVDEQHCTVRFTRMVNAAEQGSNVLTIGGGSKSNSGRDLTMEWELIQRVVPDQAATISTGAESHAAANKG
jgi:uncharacterized lipoprotein